MNPKADHPHLPRLDSLRGIAATMVGAYHTLIIPASLGPWIWMFGFLMDGRIAVAIFFVLSGLVLGMSLHREGSLTLKEYRAFLIRRFFRLYPAYVICTLPYLLLLFVLTARAHHGEFIGNGNLNRCFNVYSNEFPSDAKLLGNFVFADQYLNVVTWTLKVEAYAAIILPLLHLVSSFFRWKGWLLLLALLILLSIHSDGNTRTYLYLFYAGYLLPAVLKEFQKVQLSMPHLIHGLMLVMIISAFVASNVFPLRGPGRDYGVLFAAIGSFTLLLLLLSRTRFDNTLFRPLDHPALRFLGAISYSFYLLYPLGMDFAGRLLSLLVARHLLSPTALSFGLLEFVIAMGLAVPFGHLSHRFVEKPFIRFGARFYSRRNQGLPAMARLHVVEAR